MNKKVIVCGFIQSAIAFSALCQPQCDWDYTPPRPAYSYDCFPPAKLKGIITPHPESSLAQVFASSTAIAMAISIHTVYHSGFPGWSFTFMIPYWGAYYISSPTNSTLAGADTATTPEGHQFAAACASTRPPGYGYQIEATVQICRGIVPLDMAYPRPESWQFTGGPAVAIARPYLLLGGSGGVDAEYTVEIGLGDPQDFEDRFIYVVVLPSPGRSVPQVLSLIRSPASNLPSGFVFDSLSESWVSEFGDDFEADGVPISPILASFNDSSMDVNGDGRFSYEDAEALELLIDTTDTDLIERFDLTGDYAITEDDVDFMLLLLGADLGSGLLGDADLDGILTCADVDLLSPFPNSVLGDSDYYVAADFDLDGDNDIDDAMAVWAALRVVQPADVTLDGIVDVVDLLDFLDAFAACDGLVGPCFASGGSVDADFNGDGMVDINDQLDFFSAYASACP